MSNTHHLNHSTWECKYHIVFPPKYRKKALFGLIRKDLKEVFHRLAGQKECKIEEGHLMLDHVHMLISIPPKYSVSSTVGFLKGVVARTPRKLLYVDFWCPTFVRRRIKDELSGSF